MGVGPFAFRYQGNGATPANPIHIEPGANINRQYCREVLLMQELLAVICSIAGHVFVF